MKFMGKWFNGEIISGSWKYPNGTSYDGTFDSNKPKGKGQWNFQNGNVVLGEYTQTRRADIEGDDIKLSWKT